jgi:hypothetical protein
VDELLERARRILVSGLRCLDCQPGNWLVTLCRPQHLQLRDYFPCPWVPATDRAIGHATGTPPDWRSTGSARCCCCKCRRHVSYRTQDPERRDLYHLSQASLHRNLHLRGCLSTRTIGTGVNKDRWRRWPDQRRRSKISECQPGCCTLLLHVYGPAPRSVVRMVVAGTGLFGRRSS